MASKVEPHERPHSIFEVRHSYVVLVREVSGQETFRHAVVLKIGGGVGVAYPQRPGDVPIGIKCSCWKEATPPLKFGEGVLLIGKEIA